MQKTVQQKLPREMEGERMNGGCSAFIPLRGGVRQGEDDDESELSRPTRSEVRRRDALGKWSMDVEYAQRPRSSDGPVRAATH